MSAAQPMDIVVPSEDAKKQQQLLPSEPALMAYFRPISEDIWAAIGKPSLKRPEDELMYQLAYHPGRVPSAMFDAIAACATREFAAKCGTAPPGMREHIMMRIEKPERFERLKDYSPRQAKLFAIFAAIRHLPQFTAKIRERSWPDSWDIFFCLLVMKLDAFQSGRPLGMRRREMLSVGRNAMKSLRGRAGKTNAAAVAAATAAAPASASASASASAAMPVVPVPSKPIAGQRHMYEKVAPAYCGLPDLIAHLLCLYVL